MKRSIALLVVALAMLVGLPASAVTYDMQSLKGESGFRIEIKSTITTADFIVSPAFGFQRVAFTKGSAFEATAYACETRTYVAAQCASVATLNATNSDIEIKTGRPWIVYDVTAAETGANLSYITSRGHVTSHGNSGGSGGGVTLVTESTLPGTGNPALIYRITNATDGGDCAAGTPGTEQADCRWNGTAYEPISQGTAGLANVVEDGSPQLGADLDADGNAIDNVSVFNGSNFYADQYANLQLAVDACEAGGGGKVWLPDGDTPISSGVVLPSNASFQAMCSIEGVGPIRSGSGGSSITLSSAAGDTGIHVTGSGQVLRGFTLFLTGTDASSKGILFESETTAGTECSGGPCDAGEFGINNFFIENVNVTGPTAGGPGVGVDLRFSLKGRIDGGEIFNWDTGVLFNEVSGHSSLTNNANTLTGVKIRTNDDGMVFAASAGACAYVSSVGNTIEGNEDGVVALAGSDCAFNSFGDSFEQSIGTVGSRRNIGWDSTGGQIYMISPWFSSSGVDAGRDIVRTTDFGTYGTDIVIGGRFGNGVTYSGGADIQLLNSRYLDLASGEVMGTLYVNATDCPTWGATSDSHASGDACYEQDANALYICEPDADGVCDDAGEWILANAGDITAVGPYTSGDAYTNGVATNSSVVMTFEGTSVDANDFTIGLADDNPSATIVWFQPDAFSVISFPTGVVTLATLTGAETFTNKTLTAPLISGSMDMNIGTVNDDDCTGDQGEWWYDTTDSAFEWCPANSGTPSVLGGGSSFFVDAGTAGVPPDGHDIIVGGDEDQTCEANEICLDEGTGEVTAEGFIARPDLDAGGTVTISEGTNDGGQKFILKVPDAGIGIADVTCELNSAGLIPASCVSGGGGLAAGSQIDALRAKPIYYNDFLGGQSAVNMDPSGFLDFSAVASGTSFIVGDQESLNPQDNHPGVIGLLAAAGANSGGAIITGFNGGSKGHFDLDGGEIAEFIFSPKEASGVIIRMGFLDSTDQNDATDGIYLEANGGLAYTCKGANGGTRTTSSTVATLTADAWYRGRITVNSDKTSATCEIWNEAGSSQGSQAVTTNLPADNVNTNFGAVATHTAGSASLHLLWLDWAALEFTRSLVR